MSDEMFLIEKRGLYYRPDASGYTGIKDEAGRYSFEEASKRAEPNGPEGPKDGLRIWRESEAPEYSTRCFWDVRQQHELKKAEARITALEAERDRLREALRITRDRLDSRNHDIFDGVWTDDDFASETREADSALANEDDTP